MHHRAVPFLLAATLALGATPSQAEPRADSCRLVDALVETDNSAGITVLKEMAAGWPEADREGFARQLEPILERFTFLSGDLYRIADLGKAMQEHLIVMRTRDAGNVYLRVLFENFNGGLNFVNMNLQADYYQIMSAPPLAAPERLTCTDQ